MFDAGLTLRLANSRFREMFALPPELTRPGASFEAIIRCMTERGEYGPGDVEEMVAHRVEKARRFEPHYFERERPDGRVISIEGHPLTPGGWVTVYTDITAIRAQERLLRARSETLSEKLLAHSEDLARANRELATTIADLREAKSALAESEARIRLITRMTPAHIAHLDLTQTYTWSNDQLPLVIPGATGQVVGRGIAQVLGPEAYNIIRPELDRALAGEARAFQFSLSDGPRWLRAAFTPDLDETGRVQGVYILSVDMTEEARARQALSHTAKRELAAQLTSGLAHDFSNILTVILGLQSRLGGMDLPPKAREAVAATRAAAERGGALIERLGSISGARSLTPRPTDPAELLSGLLPLARPALPDQVVLELETVPREPVLVDSGFLQDAVLNLILNARDALDGQPGRITLGAVLTAERLEITVADTGPGFTEEALTRATQPFFTTKRGAPGSGLGLAMVYDFARASGGRLRLANAPGGGARVTIALPARRPAALPPGLVLLAEDDADIRDALREDLVALGHTVIEAGTGEEAARLLAQVEGIGLVLSDLVLGPGLSGLDLARGIRQATVCAPDALPDRATIGDGAPAPPSGTLPRTTPSPAGQPTGAPAGTAAPPDAAPPPAAPPVAATAAGGPPVTAAPPDAAPSGARGTRAAPPAAPSGAHLDRFASPAASLSEASPAGAAPPGAAPSARHLQAGAAGRAAPLPRLVLMTGLPPDDPRRQEAARLATLLPKPFTRAELAACLASIT
ncbi:response regulator [Paroceanicella profunda]|uniref:histidine kinase n=1 Tax=Paroceanicella profunda TaxID=2579971 RepID=A0A5B8FXG6_9RHOB|nr:PAS-domain containing protein [Paroceanicella profunda]QDL92304.1 response regulator [Paroceanicella profunda]